MITTETLYKSYVNAQKDNLGNPALFTRDGKMITHGELMEEIDRAAAGLIIFKTCDNFKIGVLSESSYQEFW